MSTLATHHTKTKQTVVHELKKVYAIAEREHLENIQEQHKHWVRLSELREREKLLHRLLEEIELTHSVVLQDNVSKDEQTH